MENAAYIGLSRQMTLRRELEVELRRAGSEPRTVVADEGGRFAFPRVERGLVGFVLPDVGSGSATLTTPTIEI